MAEATGETPEMWGTAIVGYGPYRYTPKSGGAEHEWFKVGFSPRKQYLTLYIMNGFDGCQELRGRLGSHTTGKACLYIKDQLCCRGESDQRARFTKSPDVGATQVNSPISPAEICVHDVCGR